MTKRALLVEDVPDISSLLAYLISHAGWEVDAVLSSAEALQLFAPRRYSLVIADINLGRGLDGVSLAQRLLALEPGLRVVLMSGDSVSEADRAQAAGLGRILVKPFDPERILALLAEL
jgi:DNA-binding response OmpR family regulator